MSSHGRNMPRVTQLSMMTSMLTCSNHVERRRVKGPCERLETAAGGRGKQVPTPHQGPHHPPSPSNPCTRPISLALRDRALTRPLGACQGHPTGRWTLLPARAQRQPRRGAGPWLEEAGEQPLPFCQVPHSNALNRGQTCQRAPLSRGCPQTGGEPQSPSPCPPRPPPHSSSRGMPRPQGQDVSHWARRALSPAVCLGEGDSR